MNDNLKIALESICVPYKSGKSKVDQAIWELENRKSISISQEGNVIVAEIISLDGSRSMKVEIDEKHRHVAHPDCPDWKYRCKDFGVACKHLLMVLVSLPEDTAEKICDNFDRFKLVTVMPFFPEEDIPLPDKVLESKVDKSQDMLKEEILFTLGTPLTFDQLSKKLPHIKNLNVLVAQMQVEGFLKLKNQKLVMA